MLIGGSANDATKSMVKKNEQESLVPTSEIVRFKLFPTQNMWTFIKLDTQTGQMWQVQYNIDHDNGRFEYYLNPTFLITDDNKVNGRFELYPTQNIYNFILLDQINGNLWQVQWSFDDRKRFVLPIKKSSYI